MVGEENMHVCVCVYAYPWVFASQLQSELYFLIMFIMLFKINQLKNTKSKGLDKCYFMNSKNN